VRVTQPGMLMVSASAEGLRPGSARIVVAPGSTPGAIPAAR